MTKTPYFCAYHARRMTNSESEALRCWTEMMRRGVRSYVACRVDAAEMYLRCALDIAFLRESCANNINFNHEHFTKPAEFLIQIVVTDNRYDEGISILSRISSISDRQRTPQILLPRFLAEQYERIEVAEKKYMSTFTRRGQRSSHTVENAQMIH